MADLHDRGTACVIHVVSFDSTWNCHIHVTLLDTCRPEQHCIPDLGTIAICVSHQPALRHRRPGSDICLCLVYLGFSYEEKKKRTWQHFFSAFKSADYPAAQ